MSKAIPIISLLISIAALLFAGSVYLRADAIADQAVARREQALVEKLQPKLHGIYEDFDTELNASQKNPKTLDDLLGPLIQLVTSVDDQPPVK